LIVGATDHTETFRACVEESGYTEPVFQADPAEEIKEKQAILSVTVAWAKCARENGYPDLADPLPAVADQWVTTPTAVLPAETTPEDLAGLLAECPADAESEYYDGGPVSAEIGFDVPGFRGDFRETADGDSVGAPQATTSCCSGGTSVRRPMATRRPWNAPTHCGTRSPRRSQNTDPTRATTASRH
jgi:hypothetical protein